MQKEITGNKSVIRFLKIQLWSILNIIQAQENVDACCQRWFYGGKLLGDKILVEEAHIQSGYIVQVIVNTEHYNHNANS